MSGGNPERYNWFRMFANPQKIVFTIAVTVVVVVVISIYL
jgi:hypothetical protein